MWKICISIFLALFTSLFLFLYLSTSLSYSSFSLSPSISLIISLCHPLSVLISFALFISLTLSLSLSLSLYLSLSLPLSLSLSLSLSRCEIWCGQSGGAVSVFTLEEQVVVSQEVINHYEPPIPSIDVLRLLSPAESQVSHRQLGHARRCRNPNSSSRSLFITWHVFILQPP